MAKTNENIQHITIGEFVAAYDFETGKPHFNPGREDKESWGDPLQDLPPAFMAEGFDVSKGLMRVMKVEDYCELFPEVLHEGETPKEWAKRQRQERIDFYRGLKDRKYVYRMSNPGFTDGMDEANKDLTIEVTSQEMADALDQDSRKTPKFVVVCGQRRTFAAPAIVALYCKRNPETENFYFGVTERKPSGLVELHRMILEENELNSKQEYSPVGKLITAIKFLEIDPLIGETDLGRLISLAHPKRDRGNRQKFFRWAKLAYLHPSLKIGERIQLPPTTEYVKDGYIPVKSLFKEDAAGLLGIKKEGSKQTDRVERVYKLSDPDSPINRKATSEEVELYFQDLFIEAGDQRPLSSADIRKVMSDLREDVLALERPVKEVLDAILSANKLYFSNLGK